MRILLAQKKSGVGIGGSSMNGCANCTNCSALAAATALGGGGGKNNSNNNNANNANLASSVITMGMMGSGTATSNSTAYLNSNIAQQLTAFDSTAAAASVVHQNIPVDLMDKQSHHHHHHIALTNLTTPTNTPSLYLPQQHRHPII